MLIKTSKSETSRGGIRIHSNKKKVSFMSRVFTNGSEDQGSILGRVIPKTKKMVL